MFFCQGTNLRKVAFDSTEIVGSRGISEGATCRTEPLSGPSTLSSTTALLMQFRKLARPVAPVWGVDGRHRHVQDRFPYRQSGRAVAPENDRAQRAGGCAGARCESAGARPRRDFRQPSDRQRERAAFAAIPGRKRLGIPFARVGLWPPPDRAKKPHPGATTPCESSLFLDQTGPSG